MYMGHNGYGDEDATEDDNDSKAGDCADGDEEDDEDGNDTKADDDETPFWMHRNVFFPTNRVVEVINIIRTRLPCSHRDGIKVFS